MKSARLPDDMLIIYSHRYAIGLKILLHRQGYYLGIS